MFILKKTDFGGKSFDIIIIDYNEKFCDFYCFQIITYKKQKDLSIINKLLENINLLIDYIKNIFDFEIYTIYFSYIFDALIEKKK